MTILKENGGPYRHIFGRLPPESLKIRKKKPAYTQQSGSRHSRDVLEHSPVSWSRKKDIKRSTLPVQ